MTKNWDTWDTSYIYGGQKPVTFDHMGLVIGLSKPSVPSVLGEEG
jgi:hypothetical protein